MIPPVDYLKYQTAQTIKRKLFNPVFSAEDLKRSETNLQTVENKIDKILYLQQLS
jgi:hypothetical protein